MYARQNLSFSSNLSAHCQLLIDSFLFSKLLSNRFQNCYMYVPHLMRHAFMFCPVSRTRLAMDVRTAELVLLRVAQEGEVQVNCRTYIFPLQKKIEFHLVRCSWTL